MGYPLWSIDPPNAVLLFMVYKYFTTMIFFWLKGLFLSQHYIVVHIHKITWNEQHTPRVGSQFIQRCHAKHLLYRWCKLREDSITIQCFPISAWNITRDFVILLIHSLHYQHKNYLYTKVLRSVWLSPFESCPIWQVPRVLVCLTLACV